MARFILSQKVVERSLGRGEALLHECGPLLGVCRLDGQKLGPDRRGQLLNHILPRRNQLGTLLYKLIRTIAGGLCGIARHAINLAAKLHRQASRDQRARILRALDHHDSDPHTGNYPVEYGKVIRSGKGDNMKLRNDRSPLNHFLENLLILLGINNINAAAEYSHAGTGVRTESTLMGARVDSAS